MRHERRYRLFGVWVRRQRAAIDADRAPRKSKRQRAIDDLRARR